MNENHDEKTGQFAKADEPLFGLRATESDAGYVHLPEEPAAEELTVAEAAEQYLSRTPEKEIVTRIPLDLPDNVALTVEQAAKLYSERAEAEQQRSETEADDKFRKEIDELRGVKEEQPAEPAFDAEKALDHPQVKEAIERVTAETETARLQHVNGLAVATQIAETSFFSQFPELAGLEGEQRVRAFAAIAQNDPQRAEQIRASVGNIAALFQRYSAENEELTARRTAKFQEYAKAESSRFEETIKDVPKAKRAEIESAIVDAIKEYGGDVDAFAKLLRGSEFASATVQRLLWDVGQYRVMKTNTVKAVAQPKPVPKVQRPGTASAVGARASLGELSQRLSRSGSVEDAYAHYTARKARG